MAAREDRVVLTTSDVGAGDITLSVSALSAKFFTPTSTISKYPTYTIVHQTANQVEIGRCPYNQSTRVLQRSHASAKIYRSTNSDLAVALSSGVKTVALGFGANDHLELIADGKTIREGTDFSAGGTYTLDPTDIRARRLTVLGAGSGAADPLTQPMTVNVAPSSASWGARLGQASSIYVEKRDTSEHAVTVTGADTGGSTSRVLSTQGEYAWLERQTATGGPGPNGEKFVFLATGTNAPKALVGETIVTNPASPYTYDVAVSGGFLSIKALDHDLTINTTNIPRGLRGAIAVQQDATGGRTITWGTGFDATSFGRVVTRTSGNSVTSLMYVARMGTTSVALYAASQQDDNDVRLTHTPTGFTVGSGGATLKGAMQGIDAKLTTFSRGADNVIGLVPELYISGTYSPLVAAGGVISQWSDISDHGAHHFNAVSTGPTKFTNATGNPGVKFNGSAATVMICDNSFEKLLRVNSWYVRLSFRVDAFEVGGFDLWNAAGLFVNSYGNWGINVQDFAGTKSVAVWTWESTEAAKSLSRPIQASVDYTVEWWSDGATQNLSLDRKAPVSTGNLYSILNDGGADVFLGRNFNDAHYFNGVIYDVFVSQDVPKGLSDPKVLSGFSERVAAPDPEISAGTLSVSFLSGNVAYVGLDQNLTNFMINDWPRIGAATFTLVLEQESGGGFTVDLSGAGGTVYWMNTPASAHPVMLVGTGRKATFVFTSRDQGATVNAHVIQGDS